MAGSYPDVPSRRIGWDADGTVLLVRRTQTASYPWQEQSAATKAVFNAEDSVAALENELDDLNQFNNHDGELALIFPELRELDGLFIQTNKGTGNFITAIDASGDTTNGFDGTFSSVIANYTDPADVIDSWRDNITSLAESNRRALRVTFLGLKGSNMSFRMMHLYGEISGGETPDRLLWFDDVTGLEFTADIDYGFTPRGGSEDVLIRLRNNSAALTANTVQYTAEDLYQDAATWFTATLPGGSTYQATQQISSIAPATTTGIITLRRITPGDQTPGVYAAREFANVASWS